MAVTQKEIRRVICILAVTSAIVLYMLNARIVPRSIPQPHPLHITSGLCNGSFNAVYEQSSKSANGLQSSSKAHLNRNVSFIIGPVPRQKVRTAASSSSSSSSSSKRVLPSLDKRKNGMKPVANGTTRAKRFPWFVNESSRDPEEAHHVVFVKVHKAASTTVFNVFIRFAMSRQLNVMYPLTGHTLSEANLGLRALLPHPKVPSFRFDILCNHVVFNHTMIRRFFPSDTKYVAIVRNPWQQVQSAYHYYSTVFRTKYLRKAVTFDEFIHNQSRFEPKNPLRSYTNNRMSIDLGLTPRHVTNPSYVTPFLRHLDSVFHLVLIADRFDESMVLLKRLFRWTMKDVVYRKLNSLKAKREKIPDPDPDLEKRFKRFDLFDVAVYEHYAKIFSQKVKSEGPDFADELQTFVNITKQVSEFCDAKTSGSELVILGSEWNEPFVVRRTECAVLKASEVVLNNVARNEQRDRLSSSDTSLIVSSN